MGLVDETYRYLYDTAAYYGTGVEYLIGGIILGALIFLWILVRIFRGKKEREIVVKVMKEEEPYSRRRALETPEAPGGITISPGEVVIKAEGKTTRIPRDRVTVGLHGGKLEISVFEPEAEQVPEKEVKEEEAGKAPPEEAIMAEEVPEEAAPAAPSEEPRTLSAALKRLARKHSLVSITLITPDGLLVDSISKSPEEDAQAASELLSEVELGDKPCMAAVEEEEAFKYLFALPFEDSHGVFLIRAKKKIPSDELSSLQEELGKALELLLG